MYQINERILNKIIDDVIESIKFNPNEMKKVMQIDEEVCGFKTDINRVIATFEAYRNEKIQNDFEENVLICHYGNPYVTVMACMHSLVRQNEVTISVDDECYGIGKMIVSMVNSAMKEYRVTAEFGFENRITKEKIREMKPSKIVCLGSQNAYQEFRDLKDIKVEVEPLFDINVYYDSGEFSDLVRTIVGYSDANLYEIEVFSYSEEFDEVIEMINMDDDRYCSVILSKDKEKIERFQKEVKTKMICVNENPYEKFGKW